MSSVLTKYHPSALNHHIHSFPKSTATTVAGLPSDSVPINPPQNSPRQWLVPMEVGTTAFPPPLPQLPATTFAARVAALDLSLQELVTNVVLLLVPLPEIFTLLRNHPILTLVGDGGAKTCRGSFVAVAVIDTIHILTVAGPAAGPDPRSYRSEGYAMAAIVIALSHLLDTLSLPRPCRFAIHVYSVNEGLVK
jgi:hypothetical protein